MATVTISYPEARVSISFHQQNGGLAVNIETHNLKMRSITRSKEDIDHYFSLFSDPKTVQYYGPGVPWSREKVQEKIENIWARRWESGDPYTAFAVFDKTTAQFIGHASLGHSNFGQGISEFTFLLKPQFSQHSSELVTTLVHQYALELIERGYKLDGAPLKATIAAALYNVEERNEPLKQAGMWMYKTEYNNGGLRNFYTIQY